MASTRPLFAFVPYHAIFKEQDSLHRGQMDVNETHAHAVRILNGTLPLVMQDYVYDIS